MINYRRPKLEELKDIARMCALTFGEYPICHDIRKEFNNINSFNAFMSEVYYVYMKAHYKKSEFFVGDENGIIKSFAILIRPNSSDANILDFLCSGAFKLFNKVSVFKLLNFLNILEKGHKPISGIQEHSWLLELLGVDKSCRGQQLGTKMLSECIIPYIKEQSMGNKPETFITFTNTEINKEFYLKNGFTEFDYTTIQMNEQTIGNWSFCMSINPD